MLSKVKGCLGLLEVGRGKEEFSPWDLGGSRSPANTLSSIPQNCKRIHFYCFQPVSWDYFVTAALRNLFKFLSKKKVIESQINWESGAVDKQHTHLCLPLSDLSCLFVSLYTELPSLAAQAPWSRSQIKCPPGPALGSASNQSFQTGHQSWWFLRWCPING